jgi:glycosyltransferase involved in cell wall biosynthesis
MKVAIVVDWLVVYAGAERVLEQMINCFPEADLFAVVDFLPEGKRDFIKNKPVTTTFIQKLPFAKKRYRNYLPLMPIAIEQLDVSAYDVVISSSHAVAKGIITGPDQTHICYIHSPMRYAWDLQHQYLKEAKITKGIKSFFARYFLHKMRLWDVRTSNGVDLFIANSCYIAKRVWKVYRREAKTIYPPVDVESFAPAEKKDDFYLTVSRMVPYKKMAMIVEAFNEMPEKHLKVVGDGPEMEAICELVTSKNIEILGYQTDEQVRNYLAHAKAFVYAALEDFGIVAVEALASGTPVIAYGVGGLAEIVTEGTGLLYQEQTAVALCEAIHRFEQLKAPFCAAACHKRALQFNKDHFNQALTECVMKQASSQ